MWDEKTSLFLNRRSDTGHFSSRISPTHFYPIIGKVATPEQAARMITQLFYNTEEFWGEVMLRSIALNDPAYHDQFYWRGRIWAPTNCLVYLWLRNYDIPKARRACADLVVKSQALLFKEWLVNGHLLENYNAKNTGEGCDITNRDRYYHCCALLGSIGISDYRRKM